MILLCGIRSESPLAMVAQALAALKQPFRMFHQRDVASCRIQWRVAGGAVTGMLSLGDEEIDLAKVEGVYMRLMDDQLLPELDGLDDADPARRHARGFHEALLRWSEVAPARVVNRAEPQGSNGSKPFQAQLIAAHGFAPPPTLITNDPEAVLAFRKEHGRIIYKSMSGIRSIVASLEEEDLERLERIRWCPVQFQKAIDGTNIRVHVIGKEVHATEIVSTHIDYRYAKRHGGETTLSALTLPRALRARCVSLARALGLDFAGIDLMRTAADEYYCFEVNPQPAFSYFEANTGQPIARAVARHLAGLPQGR
ncbi:MAG: Glutathione synthase/RimK-type ligase, ATP-grasp superfamily [Alphaproteobacteria bacterium]|nr:Glutathione synthase/RimK-type ligase, ATP-grasp superfamily [Alphaproteobacteria bacterium]